jgi:DNA-binding Lrp family transcriptional regulator
MTEGRIVRMLGSYIDAGIVRRVASVLRPRKAGFAANVMVAWAPPGNKVEELGNYAATLGAVTHTYQRPTSKKWPYSVYTMIHGRGMEKCRDVIAEIRRATGVRRYRELRTVKEYKKTRVAYFTETGR